MKKRILLPLTALLCLALLAGCRSMVPGRTGGFSVEEISKAQNIVVYDAEGNEKATLSEKADIAAFVEAMNVEDWRFTELPEDPTEAGSFTLWQTETITALLGEREAEVNEICTFHIYQNADCLTIETGLIDVTFSIPQSSAAYLRNLTA